MVRSECRHLSTNDAIEAKKSAKGKRANPHGIAAKRSWVVTPMRRMVISGVSKACWWMKILGRSDISSSRLPMGGAVIRPLLPTAWYRTWLAHRRSASTTVTSARVTELRAAIKEMIQGQGCLCC
jgi:hypothetical protein